MDRLGADPFAVDRQEAFPGVEGRPEAEDSYPEVADPFVDSHYLIVHSPRGAGFACAQDGRMIRPVPANCKGIYLITRPLRPA